MPTSRRSRSDPSQEIQFGIYRSKIPPGAGMEVVAIGKTGQAAIPGCAPFSAAPTTSPLVDNANATYWAIVTSDPPTSFDSLRIYYQLQVRAAPATASFGDVPTSHPLFQFVEALVASGITAGCGGGNYCPDDALTRGQMAVFLSKALGLHFAP
jgi:hypothetical protein